jgi:hypothetical protein
MDLVDEDPSHDPFVSYGFSPTDLHPEEERRISDVAPAGASDDEEEDAVPFEDNW